MATGYRPFSRGTQGASRQGSRDSQFTARTRSRGSPVNLELISHRKSSSPHRRSSSPKKVKESSVRRFLRHRQDMRDKKDKPQEEKPGLPRIISRRKFLEKLKSFHGSQAQLSGDEPHQLSQDKSIQLSQEQLKKLA